MKKTVMKKRDAFWRSVECGIKASFNLSDRVSFYLDGIYIF